MNKALLLASAACIISFSSIANAKMMGHEVKPYVGADYVYSSADYKGDAKGLTPVLLMPVSALVNTWGLRLSINTPVIAKRTEKIMKSKAVSKHMV